MGSDTSFLDEIAWRGLLYQRTAEDALDAHLAGGSRVGYCGFDPTASSLTIGNLIAIQLLVHWQRAGHRPVVVMGGGTGLIGDPSGKDRERPLQTREQVEENVAGQRRIFERLLDFDGPCAARIANNADWLGQLGFVEVLRDVGKHFSVNAMIQKESVRERLHNRDQGISYTEFSYVLLQAYDFLHLHREQGCTLQVAGSDQYGNVVSGIDLIHRCEGHRTEAYGVTAPLVTHADGRKIGKSEGGALWLTADRTSPYAFYQYWINVPDADVMDFVRWFTLLDRNEIEELEAAQREAPQQRPAQRALARHMTGRLHGPTERDHAEAASEALFGRGDLRKLPAALLAEVFADVPHSSHDPAALAAEGASLAELLPETTLAASRREAREFLRGGAIWVNGERCPEDRRLSEADLLAGGTILLRRGKKRWHATRWAK
ncbi:MAG: tyrosine--tRNA ligase [Myxococcota bacterium]|nr:tyrosine--tRNA ligase [Myxococcota bacterium]